MSAARPLTIGLTAALALGAVATGAAAQTSTIGVSASATAGSRQFFVEDLTGTTLTALDLGTTGQGQLFQTRVKDTDFKTTAAKFTATAEMTNLYKETTDSLGIDPLVKVPSSKISVSYAQVPTDVAGVSLAALPKIGVTGTLPLCSTLPSILPTGSPLLGSSSLLGGVLGSLGLTDAAAPLCSALGGSSATTAAVLPVNSVVVPLAEKVVAGVVGNLPVNLDASESGAFTDPSFKGVGAKDTAAATGAAAGTGRVLLSAQPNSGLDLATLLSGAINGLPLFPAVPGGTGAATTVSAVVSAMQSSTNSTVAAVGTALSGLSATDQTAVLTRLAAPAGAPVASLLSSTLDRISGTYRSFPRLNADLTGASSGTYKGTMTVTFVQS